MLKVTDEDFIQQWREAGEAGLSVRALAEQMGLSERQLFLRRRALEARYDIVLEALAGRTPTTPGRVDQADLAFFESWDAERCLSALRRLQIAEPERYITRNHFAHATGVADRTWTRYFGTFAEFRRQAGLEAPRNLHALERNVAKHVSIDGYRRMSEARAGWGERYLRDSSGRFKLILGCNDVHDRDADPFWREVFVDTARRAQPDVICINGDLFDLPEFGRYTQDPRTWDVTGRIRWVHDFLAELRGAAPNAQIDIIEGNHEYRLVRHMADASPAMMSLLSDLHGMDVADLFGLQQFEVNYVAKGSLHAYRATDIKSELQKNSRIYYDTVLACHFPEAARRGMPGWNGHHHSHKVQQFHSPVFGIYEWHQVGCGHIRDANYTDGEAWGNGFILWHVDTHKRRANAEYVPVTDFASVGGRIYTREETCAES